MLAKITSNNDLCVKINSSNPNNNSLHFALRHLMSALRVCNLYHQIRSKVIKSTLQTLQHKSLSIKTNLDREPPT